MWKKSRQRASRQVAKMTKKKLAKLIDHTLLRPDATSTDIKRLCEEATQFCFHSVCVNPHFIVLAKELLKDSDVCVTTVIGFPLGMNTTEVKVFEAMNSALLGADEIDVVINLGALKSGEWDIVKKDLSDVITITKGIIHKTIIETCYLSYSEKKKAVEIAIEAGSDFIKTSTGFGPKGALISDIKLIKTIAGNRAGIKASGRIYTLKRTIAMLEAGASRIGTSAGVKIMKELNLRK